MNLHGMRSLGYIAALLAMECTLASRMIVDVEHSWRRIAGLTWLGSFSPSRNDWKEHYRLTSLMEGVNTIKRRCADIVQYRHCSTSGLRSRGLSCLSRLFYKQWQGISNAFSVSASAPSIFTSVTRLVFVTRTLVSHETCCTFLNKVPSCARSCVAEFFLNLQ